MTRVNFKKYALTAVIILLLIFFHFIGFLNPLENFLSRILAPISKGLYSLGSDVGRIFREQNEVKILEQRLEKAEQEITELTVKNAELKFLEEENSTLRKNLNFLKNEGGNFLIANVISRGGLTADASDSQSIVIDKGANNGLTSGLAVVSSVANENSIAQGVIIGKIVNVKENTSEIYLVTNKNCKLAASILGENKTSGAVHGELGLTVNMDFVPQTENIKVGDIVATSGLEKNIKRGLVIGRISEVKKENNEVWQSATIEPLLSLDNLNMVAVLLP